MRFSDTNVTLAHRTTIEQIRRKAGHVLSSHAFTSLFLWQEQMGLRLCPLEDAYSVRCVKPGDASFFFPCGEQNSVRMFVESLYSGERLRYLREEDAAYLEREFPGAFSLSRRRDEDEYLYSIPEHLALRGRAFANMRTQVHKVERDFSARTEGICSSNVADALRIIREWTHGEHRFAGYDLRDDEVDKTAVSLLDALGLEGIITYLDGEPMAVVAGFPLTKDTFDIVVAKCSENLQGLSYYSKRELMKRVGNRYSLINLEEDLGLPGLRKMKLGLHPCGFNPIWEAVRK